VSPVPVPPSLALLQPTGIGPALLDVSLAAVDRLVAVAGGSLDTLESLVAGQLRGTTGPLGLVAVLAYSFLVAFLLPLPGELVLAMPLDLGLSPLGELAVVVVVASAGKALGGLAALGIGRGATTSGPVARLLDALPSSPGAGGGVAGRLAGVADRYGYAGLAGALAVPFAPDTAVLYAFSVVNTDAVRFAAAAFVGTTVRLLIVAGVASAVLALF
jgi:membrane protein YqaA with SNARE-associated domain